MKQNLHSDDFGYRPSVDRKLLDLIRRNKLSGVSIMAPTVTKESLKSLISLAGKRPNLILSIHLNLVEGICICRPYEIPSLVDRRGHFYPTWKLFIRLFFRLVDPEDVRREIVAQLDYLEKNGINITMIDSHQHTHALSPIAEVVCSVAKVRGIRKLRTFQTVRNNTLKARLTYFILKTMSVITHIVYYGLFKLPASWQVASKSKWTIMSWESSKYESTENSVEDVFHVVHPYLPFDSNTTYVRQIR